MFAPPLRSSSWHAAQPRLCAQANDVLQVFLGSGVFLTALVLATMVRAPRPPASRTASAGSDVVRTTRLCVQAFAAAMSRGASILNTTGEHERPVHGPPTNMLD